MSQPRVVLVGPPGAGKTTIGRRLARALNTTHVDSDALIEQDQGKPCGEVYSDLGEEQFRELEAQHVAQALQHDGVVSLGGGAVVTDSTRALLANHEVVWVDVSVEEGVCDAPTKHPPGPLSQARQESILRCATSSLSMNAHPYTARFPGSKLAPTTAHPRKWWLIFCDILKPSAEFSIFCERTARAHHRRHRTEPL